MGSSRYSICRRQLFLHFSKGVPHDVDMVSTACIFFNIVVGPLLAVVSAKMQRRPGNANCHLLSSHRLIWDLFLCFFYMSEIIESSPTRQGMILPTLHIWKWEFGMLRDLPRVTQLMSEPRLKTRPSWTGPVLFPPLSTFSLLLPTPSTSKAAPRSLCPIKAFHRFKITEPENWCHRVSRRKKKVLIWGHII